MNKKKRFKRTIKRMRVTMFILRRVHKKLKSTNVPRILMKNPMKMIK